MNDYEIIKELATALYSTHSHPKTSVTADGDKLLVFNGKEVWLNTPNSLNIETYFTTPIKLYNGNVRISRDVSSRYLPETCGQDLYLKTPAFVDTANYINADKNGCVNNENLPKDTDDEIKKLNEEAFHKLYDSYSWGDYPTKMPNKVLGSIIVDGANLKDLKGIPTNKDYQEHSLPMLVLKNYKANTINLSNFNLRGLRLENCKFKKLIGLPKVMDTLEIIEEVDILYDQNVFGKLYIDFPDEVNTLSLKSIPGLNRCSARFDVGEIKVRKNLTLADVSIEGKIKFAQKKTFFSVDNYCQCTLKNVNGGDFNPNFSIKIRPVIYKFSVENTRLPEIDADAPMIKYTGSFEFKNMNFNQIGDFFINQNVHILRFISCTVDFITRICNEAKSNIISYVDIQANARAGISGRIDLSKLKTTQIFNIDAGPSIDDNDANTAEHLQVILPKIVRMGWPNYNFLYERAQLPINLPTSSPLKKALFNFKDDNTLLALCSIQYTSRSLLDVSVEDDTAEDYVFYFNCCLFDNIEKQLAKLSESKCVITEHVLSKETPSGICNTESKQFKSFLGFILAKMRTNKDVIKEMQEAVSHMDFSDIDCAKIRANDETEIMRLDGKLKGYIANPVIYNMSFNNLESNIFLKVAKEVLKERAAATMTGGF